MFSCAIDDPLSVTTTCSMPKSKVDSMFRSIDVDSGVTTIKNGNGPGRSDYSDTRRVLC